MANYIYLPVNSEEMGNFANNAKAFLDVPTTNIQANKVTAGIGKAIYRWVNKCVSSVGAQDRLYIILHGAGVADSNCVGAERSVGKNKQVKSYERGLVQYKGGDWKTYTPEQLASTVIKEGLSSRVADIHLLTCGSGLADKKTAWAKRFKEALKTHCKDLAVTGYEGNISISPGKVQIQVNSDFYPMKEKAVVF